MALLLLLTMTAQTAWADDVTYIDADGMECTVDATMIDYATTQMGSPGEETWYIVSDTVTIDNRIELQGTVNLILADECNFTASEGLHLTSGNTLNIYVQSLGNGRLYASSYSGKDAAIGGNGGSNEDDQGGDGENAGNVNIFGGVIETNGNIGGGNGGEGYGEPTGDQDCDEETGDCRDIYDGGFGGNGGDGGTIYIYGGQINVSGAIGGGYGGYGDEDWGNDGDGFIYLSWTKATDYVDVDIYEYHGMVTLQKPFMDEQYEVYEPGVQDDINGTKLLAPSARPYAQAAATCTEVGYTQDCWYDYVTQKYYSDEDCTQEIAESEVVIEALGHAFEHFDATPATFTHGGKMEYWHCTRCDMCFLDEDGDNAIDAADTTFEGGKGNATDGYYVLMPRLGTKTIELDNSITTFKVYDDSGADSDYSNKCDGYLVLTAPEGYFIQLTGSLITETNYDYLTVYAGTTTNGNVLLEKKWSDNYDETSIGTHAASSMLLYFHSDGSQQYEGLNLTATLGEAVPHNIAIGEISGGSVSAPATAVLGDEVTLTATPTGDNLLKGITVVNNQTNEEVTVTGGTWYNNTAKFYMPHADVTVTAIFSDDKSGLSINMPKTGTLTVDLTSDITSVSIYDDGGANNDYSNDCDGYLVLTAPEGYAIQLTGSLLTETYCDNLTVYAGTTTDGYVLLWEKWSDEGDEYNPVSTSIGTHTASSMLLYLLLYFHSDFSNNYEGLNLTATLVPPAESIKMNAHGIMTYASAYDLDFASVSGLTAYVATSISGNTLTLVPVDEVPGGTGLLLRGTAGATFNVNTMDNATAINDNLLVGLTEATLVNQTTDEGIAFILANGDHGINWYKLAEESYTLKANSAYLRLPADVAPSEARALTMVFEEASGIYSATLNENGELTDDRWYTLEGVRLSSKPAKPGIYVNNGKKTVIK